jgi:hypothetical protein
MNNEKFNNWREAVRLYRSYPEGFDKNAAWLKLQQRQQPVVKRNRRAVLLLAASFVGAGFFMVHIFSKKTTIAVKQPITHPSNNKIEKHTETKSPTITPVKLLPEKEKTIATHLSKTKSNFLTTPVQQTNFTKTPIVTNSFTENDIIALTDPGVQKVAEPVQKQADATPKKPAMKIVHINELGNTNTLVQQLPPEEKAAPKFPFSKPAFAKYATEPDAPPATKQRSTFGLLRTVASLKEN